MGCWNQTCFVTNQAIRGGEEVALILIKQRDWKYIDSDIGGGGFCYPNTFFAPIQYAFFGTYDEYGSIENCDNNSKHAIECMFPTLVGRKEPGHDDVDVFHFIERGEADEVKRYSFVLIKKHIYDLIVQEFGSRFPYGNTVSYRDDLTNAVDMALKLKEEIAMSDMPLVRKMHSLTSLFGCEYVDDRLMSEWKDYFDKSTFIDAKVFISAISVMRKFWFPQTGAGGQDDERYLHYVINKKMNEIYEIDRAEEIADANENPSEYNANTRSENYRHGEESVFWSPSERAQKCVDEFYGIYEEDDEDDEGDDD